MVSLNQGWRVRQQATTGKGHSLPPLKSGASHVNVCASFNHLHRLRKQVRCAPRRYIGGA